MGVVFWRQKVATFLFFLIVFFVLVPSVATYAEDCALFDLGCHARKVQKKLDEFVNFPADVGANIRKELAHLKEGVRDEFQRITKDLHQTGVELTASMLTQIRVTINSLVSQNDYYGRVASVRTFSKSFEMGPEEKAYEKKRIQRARPVLEKLLGISIPEGKMPRIGVAFSGGGFRAACAEVGALAELEKQGILDSSLYLATLSGATWAVAPWAITSLSYVAFAEDFKKRLSSAALGSPLNQKLETLASISTLVADVIIKKIVLNDLLIGQLGLEQNFGGVFSAIDLYGILLGASLFSPEQLKEYVNINLSTMAPHVQDGQKPLPIFTAVHPQDRVCGAYDWYEFSPFEVATYASRAAIPSWAWGRPFAKGKSVAYPSPISLGECMAIFGSAFSVSVEEVYRHNFLPEGPAKRLLKGFIDKTSAMKLDLAKGVGVDTMVCNNRPPLGVSWENNFMYQLSGNLSGRMQIPFVDAGVAFGVPMVPLLYRDLDLIIVFDVAQSTDSHEFLANEDYARLHALPFPKIDRSKSKDDSKRLALNERVYSVFEGDEDQKAPIVIYLPLTKNLNYPDLDPRDPKNSGFLDTFNLKYTPEQIEQLSGLYAQGVRDAAPDIKKLLRKIVERS